MLVRLAGVACATLVFFVHVPAFAETQRYVVLSGLEQVGQMDVETSDGAVAIEYDVKNNGRGPTISERVELGTDGFPVSWQINGTSTFLSEVDESFVVNADGAAWTDATGTGTDPLTEPALYVAEAGSPWQSGLIARVLLDDPDRSVPALPGGVITLEDQPAVTLAGTEYRAFLIKGLSLSPQAVLLDENGGLVASYSSRGATILAELEHEAEALFAVARIREAARYASIQQRVAHRFDHPVRIRNVRVYDPVSGTVGEPVSVLFFREAITGIVSEDEPGTSDEVVIDGAGRTLIPGLHDMHAHLSRQSALLYIVSGVTSVRDMGNDNSFLLDLENRIEGGEIAGPRITRNGFIEGRSPYSSRNGFIVENEEEALDAVRWYAARGYWQIKIYNSMNPDWIPAITAEAQRLGMGVIGHVPAFTTADEIIAAGYEELTHINQMMLGWVLEEGEDTRTPLRLTAMKRMADLSLGDDRVRRTIDAMVERGVALDPTAVTLELLMLGRDGEINPAVAAYYDHLPVGEQRNRKVGIVEIATAADDAAYRDAFELIKDVLVELDLRGVQLLPGTDSGNGLSLHRELQIYSEAGLSPARALYLGTLGAQEYLGGANMLGSIEQGKLADFVMLDGNPLEDMSALDRMAMVVKDGAIYFPAEIWPEVGIRPFAQPPLMTVPDNGAFQPGDAAVAELEE